MFFDGDNIYFDDYKVKNNDLDLYINNINFNRNSTLQDYEEGFNKGNMFKNIYSKYKNHVYKLKVNNKRDDLLYKVQMYTFILKDLGLYLDVHPNDKEVFKVFIDIKRRLKTVKEKYDSLYGPLCLEATSDDKYDYINNPWPWKVEDK